MAILTKSGVKNANKLRKTQRKTKIVKCLSRGNSSRKKSLKYNLFAYSLDSVSNSFAYAEKDPVEIGDIILLPENTGYGPITDPSQLTRVFTITDVDSDVIYAKEDEESSAVHFTRAREKDYIEDVDDIRDVSDFSENGVVLSQKGTTFKGVNIKVPTGGGGGGGGGLEPSDTLPENFTIEGEELVYSGNESITAFVPSETRSGMFYTDCLSVLYLTGSFRQPLEGGLNDFIFIKDGVMTWSVVDWH